MFKKETFKAMATMSAKAVVGVAAIFALVSGNVGCKAGEAALVGGAIGIVAGSIIADGHYGRCYGGYRDQCYTNYDRWGRPYTNCGVVWDSCASRYSSSGFELASTSALAASVSAEEKLAAKYNLPLESATRLNAVLKDSANGDTAALAKLGLSESEMKRVANYTLPSEAALDQIGANLALSRTMTRDLVQQLMTETKAQMADVNSPVWTACQAGGKWKTNANAGTCKSTSWTGCSPETGATVCAAL